MPCRDGGPSWEDIKKEAASMEKERKQEKEYKERLDLVTRLLCGLMTHIEPSYLYKQGDMVSKELRSWWDKHKKQDQERLRREQSEKLAKKAKLREEIKKMQEELKKLGS